MGVATGQLKLLGAVVDQAVRMNNAVVTQTQMASITTQHYNIERLEDELAEQQHRRDITVGVSQRQSYSRQNRCDIGMYSGMQSWHVLQDAQAVGMNR